jgi:hypothetical protein
MSVITDIEVDAKKVLSWLAKASGKFESATPKAIAGTAGGLNISLDEQTVADLKAVWPDFVAFLTTLGVKL